MMKYKKCFNAVVLILLMLAAGGGMLPASAQTGTKPETINFVFEDKPAEAITKLEDGDLDISPGSSEVLPAQGEQGGRESPTGGMSSASNVLPLQSTQPHPSILSPHALDQEGFVVHLMYNAVWGFVNPGDEVAVARDDGAYGAAVADGVGFVWSPVWLPAGKPAEVAGGGDIEVFVNGSLETTITPAAITAHIDVLEDEVVGNIAADTGGTEIIVTLHRIGSPQVVAVTDASGGFTASFPTYDLGPEDSASVDIASTAGTVRAWSRPDAVFSVSALSAVDGYAAPGQTVAITVHVGQTDDVRWDESVSADVLSGYYWTQGDIEPGDLIEVDLGGGVVISTLAQSITARPDAALNQVTGTCPPAATVTVEARSLELGTAAETTTVADAAGHYTATFSGFDLRTSHFVRVRVADDEGNENWVETRPPHLRVYPELGYLIVYVDGPDLPVTVTIDTGSEGLTQAGDSGPNNYVAFNLGMELPSGSVITATSPTWTGAMVVPDLQIGFDTTNNRLVGEADTPGWVAGWADKWNSHLYPVQGSAVVSTVIDSSAYTLVFPNFDIRDGSQASILHYDASGFSTQLSSRAPHFRVQPPDGVVVNDIAPATSVTGTLYEADGETIKQVVTRDEMEDLGFYWLDFGGDIVTGDWITVTAGDWTAEMQVPTLSVQVDEATNLITGQGPEDLVYLTAGEWPNQVQNFVPGPDLVLDAAFFDQAVAWGDWVAAYYEAPDGNRVHVWMEWPQIYAKYQMDGRNEVFGFGAIPGNDILITITHPVDGVIATGSTTAGACDWCGPAQYYHGFPDWTLTPGVVVTVDFGDDIIESVEVVEITGEPDPETDLLIGIAPPESRLNIWVHRQGEQLFVDNVQVDANGDYMVDYGNRGWDIQLGDMFNVYYYAPRGHFVESVFGVPVIETWQIWLPLVTRNHP